VGFRVNDAGGHTAVVSTSFTNNIWHHVVLIYDGALLKVYIDGKSIGSSANASGPLASNATNLEIGRNGSSEGMVGMIDEVKIYNQAFTVTKVYKKYLAGLDNLLASKQINKEEYKLRTASFK